MAQGGGQIMLLDTIKKELAAVALSTEEEVSAEDLAATETPETVERAEGEAPAEAPEGKEEEKPRPPIMETDYRAKGFHLDVQVAPDKVVEAAKILYKENFFIEAVTGVDWLKEEEFEVVYDYNNMAELCRVVVRTRVPRSTPQLPTISEVYAGANWHERETHDFFGIEFMGHPDLSPLLLPEDADFHPLLKDYTP